MKSFFNTFMSQILHNKMYMKHLSIFLQMSLFFCELNLQKFATLFSDSNMSAILYQTTNFSDVHNESLLDDNNYEYFKLDI